MVTSVTNFGRNGLSDYLVQRITSVVLLAYFAWLAYVVVGGTDYTQWQALFATTWMRIFSAAALLSLVFHAWIGMWGVLSDYVTERLMGPKGNVLRFLLQLAIGAALFIYLIWGFQILWG